mmetsp:Transcript_7889/g.18452  ORF Transcript_7889/g.18452 Transcript_7889/m.18452 type:complete len:137 (+) Transcript_7889:88-498(+)|eukprot:4160764-Amphidinium_carterae.1
MDAFKKSAMDKAFSATKTAATAAMQNETFRKKAGEAATAAMQNETIRKKAGEAVTTAMQNETVRQKAGEASQKAAAQAMENPEVRKKVVNEVVENPELRNKVAGAALDFFQKNPDKAADMAKAGAKVAMKSGAGKA